MFPQSFFFFSLSGVKAFNVVSQQFIAIYDSGCKLIKILGNPRIKCLLSIAARRRLALGFPRMV